jgi:hypothetical protein
MAIDIAVVLVELSSRGDLNYLRLGEPSWASRVVVEPSLGLRVYAGWYLGYQSSSNPKVRYFCVDEEGTLWLKYWLVVPEDHGLRKNIFHEAHTLKYSSTTTAQ